MPPFEEEAILVPRVRKAAGEIGRTGLIQFSGTVDEEWLKDLKGVAWGMRGSRALQTYREMTDNDPTIGALFNAICWLSRVVEWRVEAENANDPRVALIEAAMNGMAHTWEDTLSEIVRGTLSYGWQVHEIVYGTMPYGVGWRKLPIRSQDSLVKWDFDDTNHAVAMFQQTLPDYKLVRIPLSKCLHFRTESIKDNPEGRSILRNAYRPWYFKKHMEQIEGIGVERDLAGLPVAYVPAGIMDQTLPNAQAIFDEIKAIVTGIHRDEQEGVVMPLAYDEQGNQLYKLELLSTGGQRQLDINAIINRYDLRILQICLADFIQVGHEKTGSFALASSKTNLFAVAIGVFLQQIAAEFNRQAIPDLCLLNGLSEEDCPQLIPGDIESQDLAELGTYLQALSSIGIPLGGDPVLENHLRAVAKLPALTPEQVKEREAMGSMNPGILAAEAAANAPADAPPAKDSGAP